MGPRRSAELIAEQKQQDKNILPRMHADKRGCSWELRGRLPGLTDGVGQRRKSGMNIRVNLRASAVKNLSFANVTRTLARSAPQFPVQARGIGARSVIGPVSPRNSVVLRVLRVRFLQCQSTAHANAVRHKTVNAPAGDVR
jgi:hypothetical protein